MVGMLYPPMETMNNIPFVNEPVSSSMMAVHKVSLDDMSVIASAMLTSVVAEVSIAVPASHRAIHRVRM